MNWVFETKSNRKVFTSVYQALTGQADTTEPDAAKINNPIRIYCKIDGPLILYIVQDKVWSNTDRIMVEVDKDRQTLFINRDAYIIYTSLIQPFVCQLAESGWIDMYIQPIDLPMKNAFAVYNGKEIATLEYSDVPNIVYEHFAPWEAQTGKLIEPVVRCWAEAKAAPTDTTTPTLDLTLDSLL